MQARVWNYGRGYELTRQLGEALFELAVDQTRTNRASASTTQELNK
jgi:hypothetical protein